LNPQTRVPVASMLTTRPPKPSDWIVTLNVDLEMMWMEVVMADFVGCSDMFVNLNVESRCLWILTFSDHFNTVVLTFCGQF
jgi:hypothetical protein